MVLSVFVVDLYVFFRFLYVHILKKEKNELFRPCQGYSSGSLWLGRCLQGFPGLKIESLRLPKCCLGLSNNNLEGPKGLSKLRRKLHFSLFIIRFFLNK